MSASSASARIDGRARPPVWSSPRPTKMNRPRSSAAAARASPPSLTSAARAFDRSPFGAAGQAPHQQVAHHQRQHGVAQELEPLVVGAPGRRRLVEPGVVRQRGLGQRAVAEGVAEARSPAPRRDPVSSGSRAVHGTASISPMSDATNICCVKCNSILDKATFQGLEVDLCPKCGGLWLDRGEITRAAKLPEAELARLRDLLAGTAGPPPGPDRDERALPRLPGEPLRGDAGRGPRRLLRPLPRDLPRQGRARGRRRRRPRARPQHQSRSRSSRRSPVGPRRAAQPGLDPAAAEDPSSPS